MKRNTKLFMFQPTRVVLNRFFCVFFDNRSVEELGSPFGA